MTTSTEATTTNLTETPVPTSRSAWRKLKEEACFQGYLFTNESTGRMCPRVFDGWLCWNETEAGDTIENDCPNFIPGFNPNRFAYKQCLDDGTWFRHPQSNEIWSNYTDCIDIEEFGWRQFINILYEIGYTISMIMLLLSLIIFSSFKILDCTRVRLHKHLFVSFIISNVLWLFWYELVISNAFVLLKNPEWCQALHVLVHYFMLANYFWMFCEGFYLHTLLVLAFFRSEAQLLKGFYIFGWIGPLVPTLLYVFFRIESQNTQSCWVEPTSWTYILSIPVCLCLILSLGFLINILRVLLKKLKANQKTFNSAVRRNSSIGVLTDNQHSLKKAVRATLILIPLLGLHYFLIPFRPASGSSWEVIYEVVAAASASLQGFCVALLFCFCNAEVVNVFRRRCCPRRMEDKTPTNRIESCPPTSMSTIVMNKQSSLTEPELYKPEESPC